MNTLGDVAPVYAMEATPIIIVGAVIAVLVVAVGAVLWFLVKYIARW
jgi:hypothetical protein